MPGPVPKKDLLIWRLRQLSQGTGFQSLFCWQGEPELVERAEPQMLAEEVIETPGLWELKIQPAQGNGQETAFLAASLGTLSSVCRHQGRRNRQNGETGRLGLGLTDATGGWTWKTKVV